MSSDGAVGVLDLPALCILIPTSSLPTEVKRWLFYPIPRTNAIGFMADNKVQHGYKLLKPDSSLADALFAVFLI